MKKIGAALLLLVLAGCSEQMPATLDHPSPDQKLFGVKNGLSIHLAEDS